MSNLTALLFVIGLYILAIGWAALVVSLWFTTHWTVALVLTLLALDRVDYTRLKK